LDAVVIDRVIEHEIAYSEMIAQNERTEFCTFLYAPTAPDYRDGNRAIGLRLAGKSAEWIAQQVVSYYSERGLRPIADVDPIAEEQGIGDALRAGGLAPTGGDRLLMRYALDIPPIVPDSPSVIEQISNETGLGEASEWIETAVADDVGWPEEAMWRTVAECEARFKCCRLYLAKLNSEPAGACDLFEHANWARLESVVTRPELRRRGIAASLVTRAVTDSLSHGNKETYLYCEPGGAAERLYCRLGFEPWYRNLFQQHRG